MNEKKNPLDFIVRAVNYVIDVLARVLVDLFDGAKSAIDHANPSIFALVATLLPFALPLPVAFMTAHSARNFFSWDPWAANVLGFGLEGLGLLVWVRLVDSVIDYIRSNNAKVKTNIYILAGIALAYEAALILINVILAWKDGADATYALTLLVVCLLPAMSAVIYGYNRQTVITELERERAEAKAEAERIRQERRADRKEAQALKLKYAADVEGVELEKKPFRRGKHS